MTWSVTFFRRAFVGASVAWFGALPLATLASSQPSQSTVVYLFGFAVYLVGGLLCHQRPERSFFLWGSQMPVCARCTGIYVGAAIFVLTHVAFRRANALRHGLGRDVGRQTLGGNAALVFSGGNVAQGFSPARTREGGSPARIDLIAASIPTAATLAYEWTTGQTPANWIRAAAGIPIGVVVAWIVLRLVRSAPRDEVN